VVLSDPSAFCPLYSPLYFHISTYFIQFVITVFSKNIGLSSSNTNMSPSAMVSEVKFTYQLPGQKQYGLGCEHKVALNKEVLERLAEGIDCHRIVTRFRTKPVDMRYTNPSLKLSVDINLIA